MYFIGVYLIMSPELGMATRSSNPSLRRWIWASPPGKYLIVVYCCVIVPLPGVLGSKHDRPVYTYLSIAFYVLLCPQIPAHSLFYVIYFVGSRHGRWIIVFVIPAFSDLAIAARGMVYCFFLPGSCSEDRV